MPSKQFTERITINCTKEQKAAFKQARAKSKDGLSDNQKLHKLLADYCASEGIEYPAIDPQVEGEGWRIGKGGKFVKP